MGLGSECTCKLHKNIKTQSSGADPRGSGLGACSGGSARGSGRIKAEGKESPQKWRDEGFGGGGRDAHSGNKNDKILGSVNCFLSRTDRKYHSAGMSFPTKNNPELIDSLTPSFRRVSEPGPC